MSIDLIKRLGIFVVLVLVQGLVFNHIHLFNCATPLRYIPHGAPFPQKRSYAGR